MTPRSTALACFLSFATGCASHTPAIEASQPGRVPQSEQPHLSCVVESEEGLIHVPGGRLELAVTRIPGGRYRVQNVDDPNDTDVLERVANKQDFWRSNRSNSSTILELHRNRSGKMNYTMTTTIGNHDKVVIECEKKE